MATHTFRASPARPARRIADPRVNASHASGSSAVRSCSISDGEPVPGWGGVELEIAVRLR